MEFLRRSLSTLFVICLCMICFGCAGVVSVDESNGDGTGTGGSAAPPASIPAPVSPIGVTVSSPDDTGLLMISGGPGSALGGATVVATNTGAGGTQVQVTAESDGSFFLEIPGKDGDVIELYQELDGQRSDPVQVVGPCGAENPPC